MPRPVGRPAKNKVPDLGALLEQLGQGVNRVATRPDINSYRPHAKQIKFHKSAARRRLYIGGNRSGKTVGGVVEDLQWLQHRHPYRKTPEGPIRGRLVCVDYPNGWQKIVAPVLSQWVPPSALVNGSWDDSYHKAERTLHLANGSFLEIMSYDQEIEAFAGSSRHFIHFDEEPPRAIFQECKMRVMDTGGSMWITMTPVEGLEWIEDEIFDPFQKMLKEQPEILKALQENPPLDFWDVIEVDTEENTHLSQTEIDATFSDMDDDEKDTRKKGKYVRPGGLIYKDFDANPASDKSHVIGSLKGYRFPRNVRIIASMDHGFNNPTSWHWHAVFHTGQVVTFAEHYMSHWTVAQHAQKVHEIEHEWRIVPEMRVGDPATAQKSAINGNSIHLEYMMNGVPFVMGNNAKSAGINRVAEYIRQGKWFVTEDCPKLIWELKRYRWKTRVSKKLQERNGPMDEPHDKDNHACDDTRYFFMSQPELTPREVPVDLAETKKQIQALLGGHTPHNVMHGAVDLNLYRRNKTASSEITEVTDENMGGIW